MDKHIPTEAQLAARFQPGQSGNAAGKPKGAKNKLTLVKEAAERGEGYSPAEMLIEIARRNFAQQTTAGDNLAMKAIIEANKFLEPTANAEVNKEMVGDLTMAELQAKIQKLIK